MAQPTAVCIDHIALAILGDLLDSAVAVILSRDFRETAYNDKRGKRDSRLEKDKWPKERSESQRQRNRLSGEQNGGRKPLAAPINARGSGRRGAGAGEIGRRHRPSRLCTHVSSAGLSDKFAFV